MSCRCGHDAWAVPVTRTQAVELAGHQNQIKDLLENVVTDAARWMSVMRCRACGAYWAEDCISTGHVDLLFVYPIETDDPQGWLERAKPLGV